MSLSIHRKLYLHQYSNVPIMKILACLSTLILVPLCSFAQGSFRLIQKDNQLEIRHGAQLMAIYWYDSTLSKPILYPVFSPSGEVITRSYPFEIVEGESHDHPHHTGISFTYGSNKEVNGNSFWANPHDKTPIGDMPRLPQIRHVKTTRMESNPTMASLSAMNQWLGENGNPVLDEFRTMDFTASDNQYIIDFTFELAPVDTTVTFNDTKEGMFAIRVADWLAEAANGTMFRSTGVYTNANGEKTEKEIWGKRSEWVNLQGEKDDKTIGLTIMHHPSSINFPTFWHARGYGCFAANPIGQYDYQNGRKLADPQHRQLSLKVGEKALFRFRMLIYEGSRSKAQLDSDYKEYIK